MPRRRLPLFCADIHGRPSSVQRFIQGPSRSVRSTAFRVTEFPAASDGASDDADDDPAAGADRLASYALANEQVLVELQALTPKQRQAIHEVIFKGRTLTDLADETRTSLDALSQRVRGTPRRGGKRHGGISRKAPILYALWMYRHRDWYDMSEVLNAISRAIDSLNTKQPDRPA